ncbi:MAG: NAD(P)-dependent alcohol dehydrogenase [Frankiaceae bacterium]
MSHTNPTAVLHGVADVRLENRAVPKPGPREVLVEVRSVGVCGSDVHYYEHGRIGDFVVDSPLVLGHEASGAVVGVGSDAHRLSLGQRVALEPGVPCLHCEQCRSGRYNLCPDVRFFATPPFDGAFAAYVTIHEDFAFAVPDSMTDDAAALIEPLSVGVWANRKAAVVPGDRVLVTGAGPIGLLAMQVARCFGAQDVTITDVNPYRLDVALRTGATRALDVRQTPLAEAGVTADVLLECSGAPAVIADGIRALRPAGRAVLVGMGGDEVPLPLATVQSRELTITGTFRYANTYPAAIALAAAGRVDLDALVTGHFSLLDAEEALRASRYDDRTIKAIVTPGLLASTSPSS